MDLRWVELIFFVLGALVFIIGPFVVEPESERVLVFGLMCWIVALIFGLEFSDKEE